MPADPDDPTGTADSPRAADSGGARPSGPGSGAGHGSGAASAASDARAVEVLDSIAYATPAMAGAVIVSGSHGGMSAARYAAGVRPRLVVFNDAGGGLDDAGFSGLPWLDAQGLAAATVAHHSARIGEARSTLDDGVISRANSVAATLGVRPGMRCRDAVALCVDASPPRA